MTLDRLTLGAYFREIESRVAGRRIEKVRPHGKSALRLELSSREVFFVDVSRTLAGLWLVPRAAGVPADSREVEGPSRQAVLLFKKYLEGARIDALSFSPARLQGLLTSRVAVFLRPYGSPGASLMIDGAVIAHFGLGEAVFSVPDDAAPVFDLAAALDLLAEVARASREDRRAVLASRDPGLLPLLRRWPISETARASLLDLLRGCAEPRPFLAPLPGDDAANAEAPPAILAFEPDGASYPDANFTAAAARVYVASRRADLFRERLLSQVAKAKADVARLLRLTAALERDRGRWPDPAQSRHHAEALLAAPPEARAPSLTTGSRERDVVLIALPDPHTGNLIEIRVNPRLSLPQNANALYGRARNVERQQAAFDERWESVALSLDEAERSLAALLAIRSLDEMGPPAQGQAPGASAAAPKRYLTSRGLEIIFGRSAAENHDVTFKVARREDIWFHVLDAPGGHVVLRNTNGRANREDIAEAATVAGFLSERRTESQVDVQYTERKHVHPAGGGKGRVRVTHSEVIRVAPRDPSGRLRSRS